MEIEEKQKIELISFESGLVWPICNQKKALSASRLTSFLKEIQYQDIPVFVRNLAIKRGEAFHQAIQDYFENRNYPDFVFDTNNKKKLSAVEKRIKETIVFLEKNNPLGRSVFEGSEKLHYVFYKNELIATYVDIVFDDCIVELKTHSPKSNNVLNHIIFEIQLLIQHLCTGKRIYLLWSSGEGLIFREFQVTKKLLSIFDILIEVERNKSEYSANAKKMIAERLIKAYELDQPTLIN